MFCPNCGKEVSDKAITCPQCAHPFEANQKPKDANDAARQWWNGLTKGQKKLVAFAGGGAVFIIMLSAITSGQAERKKAKEDADRAAARQEQLTTALTNAKTPEEQRLAELKLATGGPIPNKNLRDILVRFDSDELTSDQKSAIFEKESKGRWFIISGAIADVGTSFGVKYVTVKVNSENNCDIQLKRDFDIMAYKKGQPVTFVGKFMRLGTGLVVNHGFEEGTDVTRE